MTKVELIAKIALRNRQLTMKDAEVAVKMILDRIATTLSQGRRVEIRDFGSFSLNHRAARQGRNPKTGVKVWVPSKYTPHFKAGRDLRERIRIK